MIKCFMIINNHGGRPRLSACGGHGGTALVHILLSHVRCALATQASPA